MKKWIIDPDHSVAAFAIRHMMIANVRGQFNKINGTIFFDEEDQSRSSVEIVIDVSSVVTGIKKRDDHLRSPDFFDAEGYPHITFKSRNVERVNSTVCRITGDLMLHGVTREIILDAGYAGPVKSPFGGEITMGFTVVGTLNRDDFGMRWNEAMDGGGVMIGKEVQIFIDIEADLTEERQ